MLGEMATMTGYVKAPGTTYVVKHPLKARKMARVRHELEDAFTPGRLALGLSVLAAIPLGIWLGRRYAQVRRARAETD
jgi:hypothetical protein